MSHGYKKTIKIQNIKYFQAKLCERSKAWVSIHRSFKCHVAAKLYNCKMERDEPKKKDPENKLKKNDDSGEQSEDSYVSEQGYESSFVVSSDNQESGDYGFRPNLSDDDFREHKSKKERKKEKKKSKKHKKEKKMKKIKADEDDFDEDDLEVIDNQDDNRLTRLKKKKEPRDSDGEYENEFNENVEEDDYVSEAQQMEENSYSGGPLEQESEEYSKMNEIIEHNKEIFDPFELKKLALAEQDRETVQTDLPERYLNMLKNNIRGSKKKLVQVKESFEKEDHAIEANWIYYRMRSQGWLESFEERDCKDRIKRVLECMHKEHLEIMYIFYYRKKIYSDYLNLDNLWKIQEFDQEWHLFRERQKKIINFLEATLPSYTEVPPELSEMATHTYQPKYLKYFDDYERFMLAKWTTNTEIIKTENPLIEQGDKDKKAQKGKKSKTKIKAPNRLEFIGQMVQRGVIEQLQNSQIFLTPQNLCFNLNRRAQERKPRSPQQDPKDEFERILGTSNPQTDKVRFPLLVGDNRFRTISKYLSFELFCYPQLRKLLRQKYYKKLVISTTPTFRGNQDIDLYSIYFPVKRIKEKPISTLKRQIWILAREAEKLGHIKLDLKFQWEITSTQKSSGDRDQVYMEIIRNYYDMNANKNSDIWNLFRKRVISNLLNDYVIPSLMKEIKDDLTREGEKEIINACCAKLKAQLNKSPSLKEGKPIKILSLVLQDTKLGVAFVDEAGKSLHTFQATVSNEQQLKEFVNSQNLKQNIKDYKPDMILIAANCKKAQTLRKELRSPDLFSQSIFCAFGEYEVPRLIAKKKIIQGFIQEQAIIEAISMARLKKNPMAEIISLWSEKQIQNGILSMNLHPYQRFVNQAVLKSSLQSVIVEIVNLVGIDINDLKKNEHIQNQLQFIAGLGPRKSQHLLEKLKDQNSEIINRIKIVDMVGGEIVPKNCSPFFRVETSFHKSLFQKIEKDKKGHTIPEYELINLLDMTRIPEQWYRIILKNIAESYKSTSITEMRTKKQFSKLSDSNIFLLELFKNPERIRSINWKFKDNPNPFCDQQLVKSQIMSRFKNPRDPERVMENKEIFFNLLKETPDTLKRYMIMPVKVLRVKTNYLNVIIPENGLFGYIKLQSNKSAEEYQKIYQKGTIIKAIIIGFPFDEKSYREQQPTQEQQLLKVEMALDFPHKENADRHQNIRHDCMSSCFPAIVKAIHPNIDLQKDRFELRKEDKPIIENREERQREKVVLKNLKPDFRRISHPKFRNISAQPAIELMKSENNGEFIIRPSSQGPEYLVITWKFFGKVIVHIKIRCQHKGIGTMNMSYRIEDKDNRSYNSLEDIIEKCIKPMNTYVQDVASNRKFLDRTLEQIENTIKRDMSSDSGHIYYYFGVSEEYPQYFLLIYMYKQKKPIRELIKVKSSGLYFHEQQFSNARDLIAWFKEHLKEKEYQKYVKNMTIQMQKMK